MQPDVRATNGRATVWVVEDSVDYRQTLQELIDGQEDFQCPQAFETGEELFEHLNRHFAPEMVVVDIGLPGMSGIELVERLHNVSPGTQQVCLTIHEDNEKIFDALCAGASGYLLKTATPNEILDGLREASNGGVPFTPAVAQKVLNLFRQLRAPLFDYGLTDREREVLAELVNGRTKAEMGKVLFVTRHTVDTHMRSIYAKLHVHSRTQAVVKALRENLVGGFGPDDDDT